MVAREGLISRGSKAGCLAIYRCYGQRRLLESEAFDESEQRRRKGPALAAIGAAPPGQAGQTTAPVLGGPACCGANR
jgi:hypothetical protein